MRPREPFHALDLWTTLEFLWFNIRVRTFTVVRGPYQRIVLLLYDGGEQRGNTTRDPSWLEYTRRFCLGVFSAGFLLEI